MPNECALQGPMVPLAPIYIGHRPNVPIIPSSETSSSRASGRPIVIHDFKVAVVHLCMQQLCRTSRQHISRYQFSHKYFYTNV